MSDIKLVWSLSITSPDKWIIDRLKMLEYPKDEMMEKFFLIDWEMSDDIDAIISHVTEAALIDGYSMLVFDNGDSYDEYVSHIEEVEVYLFIIRDDMFEVLKYDLSTKTICQVNCIKFDRSDMKYVYIGIRNGFYSDITWIDPTYCVGIDESDVVNGLLFDGDINTVDYSIQIIKLPINHKGGPTYAFRYCISSTPYNEDGHWLDVREKDDKLYYNIESTFPRDPEGYYDRCMELTAGEIRNYNKTGRLIDSLWEYWSTLCKGYEDFMNPEYFQEMMSMRWPILWYHDEFTDWDVDEEDMK